MWEALLAVADAAGGDWPTIARGAAVTLVMDVNAATPSLGVRLLGDLRTLFGNDDSLSTDSILDGLVKMEEAPWSDLRGKPIDSRRLANYLKPYGVISKVIRTDSNTIARGYTRESLWDAWLRYLPTADVTDVTSVSDTTVTNGACRRCNREGCGWCEP